MSSLRVLQNYWALVGAVDDTVRDLHLVFVQSGLMLTLC